MSSAWGIKILLALGKKQTVLQCTVSHDQAGEQQLIDVQLDGTLLTGD